MKLVRITYSALCNGLCSLSGQQGSKCIKSQCPRWDFRTHAQGHIWHYNSLTHKTTLSITKGHFPKLWKVSRVVSIPKTKANIVHLCVDQYLSSQYTANSLKNISIRKSLTTLLNTICSQMTVGISDSDGKSTLTALLAVTCTWLANSTWPEYAVYFLKSRKFFKLFPTEDLRKSWNNLICILWL